MTQQQTVTRDSEADMLVAALPTPATIANPYPLYERLRDATPIFGYRDYPPGTIPGQDEAVTAWVLMKYDEVAAAARDHETFSSRDPLQEQSSAPTLMLVNHDNPEHNRLRALVNVAFSRKEIELIKPWIAARIAEMFETIGEGDIEVVTSLTSVIPARVMMRLLGCPDTDAAQCRGWATAFMLSADRGRETGPARSHRRAAHGRGRWRKADARRSDPVLPHACRRGRRDDDVPAHESALQPRNDAGRGGTPAP